MQMNPLGRTGLTISELCLGTMTIGGPAQQSLPLIAGYVMTNTPGMLRAMGRSIGDMGARVIGSGEVREKTGLVKTGLVKRGLVKRGAET